MHLAIRIPVAMVVLAAVGCAPSTPAGPTAAPTATSGYAAQLAAGPWAKLKAGGPPAAAAGVKAEAVIDGFRVHPDPGDDGVIRVVEGENVTVNASDIASPPPAPQSFLVVNWGDGGNQRVGCGPCRMDHSYAPGRYTLVASADGLPGDRSITLTVDVRPGRRAPNTRFQYWGFLDGEQLHIGDPGRIFLPLEEPPGVTLLAFDVLCSPSYDVLAPNGFVEIHPPEYVAFPFVAAAPGTCTLYIFGEDANGPFTETSTLTIVP
jgi:hypothetical protein